MDPQLKWFFKVVFTVVSLVALVDKGRRHRWI